MSARELPIVRTAKPSDWAEIMSICQGLHEENAVSPVSWPMVEAAMIRGLNNDRAMIGVIGEQGVLQGAVYLKFSQLWYSEAIFLEELFLYVRPEHRKSPAAMALLQHTRDSAKKLDVPLLIGVISNERTQGKLRLYERKLGSPIGGYFWLEKAA